MIDIIREIIFVKKTKPLEVKIDIDEGFDVVYDPTKNTVYQLIYENMGDTLVYLSLIDSYKTQNLIQVKVEEQYQTSKNSNKINPAL